jgi:hypothetical protein
MALGNAQQTTGQSSFSSITTLLRSTSVQNGPSTFSPAESDIPEPPLTNLGPVTTLFTPPSSCIQTTTSYSDDPVPILWLMNQGEGFPGDCSPTAAGGKYASATIAQYYSPAVCPSGVSSSPVYYYSAS